MAERTCIAVIGGTGAEGSGLALRWASADRYRVVLGSRVRERAQAAADELNALLGRPAVEGMSNEDAAAAGEVVVLTVPYAAHAATLQSIRQVLAGKVLVDVTVPLVPPRVSRFVVPAGGSAAQEAQALLGAAVRVVSAFQNVGAAHLRVLGHPIPCDVLVCGDDKPAKAAALELAEAAGMRGLDAGPLSNSVVVEGLTAVLIGINARYHADHAGILITGLEDS